jgi:hypothetical protein
MTVCESLATREKDVLLQRGYCVKVCMFYLFSVFVPGRISVKRENYWFKRQRLSIVQSKASEGVSGSGTFDEGISSCRHQT